MELKHLRSFVVAADELHFGRASRRLFMGQSALSKQIATLEDELGVRLFERDRPHVVLTDAGRTLRRDAEQILDHADSSIRRARVAASGGAGELHIGSVPPLLFSYLPASLGSYRAQGGAARIVLSETNSRDGIEAVSSRRFDAAFIRLPADIGVGLDVRPVLEGPMMLALADRDPLARHDSVSLADCGDRALIVLSREREPNLHDLQLSLCRTAGFQPSVVHEVDRTLVALALVAAGLGFCFVPWTVTALTFPGVRFLPMEPTAPRLAFGLVWRSGSLTTELHRLLDLDRDVGPTVRG